MVPHAREIGEMKLDNYKDSMARYLKFHIKTREELFVYIGFGSVQFSSQRPTSSEVRQKLVMWTGLSSKFMVNSPYFWMFLTGNGDQQQDSSPTVTFK